MIELHVPKFFASGPFDTDGIMVARWPSLKVQGLMPCCGHPQKFEKKFSVGGFYYYGHSEPLDIKFEGLDTLAYWINVQDGISKQVGKFLKIKKSAG